MKLRNKKTEEIGYLYEHLLVQDIIIVYDVKGIVGKYKSITELCEEWEDYNEPKYYWYIDDAGVIQIDEVLASEVNMRKSIGNYFETKEEAEKAVEKLKGWKRLKDKGFKFDGYNACSVDYDIDEQYRKYISQDLDLLFGGEE